MGPGECLITVSYIRHGESQYNLDRDTDFGNQQAGEFFGTKGYCDAALVEKGVCSPKEGLETDELNKLAAECSGKPNNKSWKCTDHEKKYVFATSVKLCNWQTDAFPVEAQQWNLEEQFSPYQTKIQPISSPLIRAYDTGRYILCDNVANQVEPSSPEKVGIQKTFCTDEGQIEDVVILPQFSELHNKKFGVTYALSDTTSANLPSEVTKKECSHKKSKAYERLTPEQKARVDLTDKFITGDGYSTGWNTGK